MTATSETPARVRTFAEPANQMLLAIHQHRLLTTDQLHALTVPDQSLRSTQRLLGRLELAGLIARVHDRGGARGSMSVWFLTLQGADVVQSAAQIIEPRRRVLSPEQAAGPLQQHTLALNEAAITFVQAARECGDDCGPFAWRHEIAHQVSPHKGDVVITDGLLRYLTSPPDAGVVVHYRFLELDRATVPADALAAKLSRYAALARYQAPGGKEPLWRERYRALPVVLVILTGNHPQALRRRLRTVVNLCRADPHLTKASDLSVTFCLLKDLTEHGPFAPSFTLLRDPGHPYDWLLQQPDDGGAR